MINDREQGQSHDGQIYPERGFFGKPSMKSVKSITDWCGVLVTFTGIMLGVISGGSLEAAGVATVGVLLTCSGHLLSSALAKHQAVEQAADRKKAERDKRRIERRIDRIKYGAGGALGYDIEDDIA
jgi:hypothetical protein